MLPSPSVSGYCINTASSSYIYIHTHTRVSQYQNGKTNLDFTEARDSEWQWHQLGHMQVCTSLPTGQPRQHPTTQLFTGRMPFLPPNQQRQSTEGTYIYIHTCIQIYIAPKIVRTNVRCWYIHLPHLPITVPPQARAVMLNDANNAYNANNGH